MAPDTILEACLKDALRGVRKDLPAASMPRNEMLKVVRLWATATLVDRAGLGNRDAMSVWDEWASGTEIPPWGLRRKDVTQSSEISFANSRRDIVAPRTEVYLKLLKATR